MVYRPDIDERLCFVLMPLREPFLGYYDKIIRPAAKTAGLETLQSQEIYGTRPIIHDVWDQIWKAKLVIAEVTDKNPNVNYELGICHSLGVPTILLTQTLDDVPFDYQHRRCIVYDTRSVGWDDKLREDIRKTIETVIQGKEAEEELSWPYDLPPKVVPRFMLVPGPLSTGGAERNPAAMARLLRELAADSPGHCAASLGYIRVANARSALSPRLACKRSPASGTRPGAFR